MRSKYLFPYLLSILFFLPPGKCELLAQAQNVMQAGEFPAFGEDTVVFTPGDTIRLSSQFILRVFRVEMDSATVLNDSADYTVGARNGLIQLTGRFLNTLVTGSKHVLRIQYIALPMRFDPSYSLRRLNINIDSTVADTIQIAAPAQPMNLENIFGSELQKNGYIGRGIVLGTNRDLSINSGFRLQLSGNLSEDISLVGALTDENTPIQPEGNTRTLQELDKVFIRISGKTMGVTLGDYNLTQSKTEFGKINRKLSGVMGEANIFGGTTSAAFATLKGTFQTMQFSGIDGVQGPYRLTGKNGEQPVLVLAGTEKVYIDGMPMIRGESNDYVIEYASGEIYFKPKRIITSYSRITIDFEYAERQFVRTLLSLHSSSSVFSDKLKISAGFSRESDDRENPIDAQFSEEDKLILARAGADPQKASRSGITYVGFDSVRLSGAGQYSLIDSVVQGQTISLFRYAPGTDSATYALSFSFVGTGMGSYRRKTIGIFEFAGKQQGDYEPLRLLPLPRLRQNGNLELAARPIPELTVSGEVALSNTNENRFAEQGEASKNGMGTTLNLAWNPRVAGIGNLDIQARFRSLDPSFEPLDRINDVEFNRRWDLPAEAQAKEIIREASLGLTPFNGLRVFGSGGFITRGDFSSNRIEGGATLENKDASSGYPDLGYSFENIASSTDGKSLSGNWFRQHGTASYRLPYFKPLIWFEQERKILKNGASDSINSGSMALLDIRPGIEFPEFWRMVLSASVGFRTEDATLLGSLLPQTQEVLQQYTWALRPWNNLSGLASVTIRNKNYSDEFRSLGNKDIQTILIKSQFRFVPFSGGITSDVLYNVSTERTSKLQRAFLNVPIGQGNYIYLGDLNRNGIQDENEFEVSRFDGDYILITLPTDQLFPVIDVMASARLGVRLARLLENSSGSKIIHALQAFSSETFVRIEEKNQDEQISNIYLLKLRKFLNDSTTLRGFQNLRQDVFLFENANDFSMRFRFDQNRGFSQYALANERSYRRERSVRLRTQLVSEFGFQVDAAATNDIVHSTQASNRARAITATNYVFDLSYRPARSIEIGFVAASKEAVDDLPAIPVRATIQTYTLRSSISFKGPGRIHAEIERSDISLSSAEANIPFELTDGKPDGKSFLLRLNVDYRLTSFLQATFSYLGRNESSSAFLHTMRAEVKAYF